MQEYTVEITGQYADGRTITCQTKTKAERSQMALLQVSGIDPRGLWWGETGAADPPPDIVAYRVLNSR